MQNLVDTTAPMRLALYGGAFDPVHCAHVRVAHYALQQVRLDRVVFIPAAQSPLKTHAPCSSDAARLQMLGLAVRGEAGFAVDTIDIQRGGVSYAIETVSHFRALYPNSDLFWIIGADQFEQLEHWHRINTLVEMLTFLVLARPGADLVGPVSIPHLRYQVVAAPLMFESSSEIRERCRNGRSLRGWVPAAVEAFISEQGLYKDTV